MLPLIPTQIRNVRIAETSASTEHVEALSRLGIEYFADLAGLDLNEIRVKPQISASVINAWVAQALEITGVGLGSEKPLFVAPDPGNVVAAALTAANSKNGFNLKSFLSELYPDCSGVIQSNVALNELIEVWNEVSQKFSREQQMAAICFHILNCNYRDTAAVIGSDSAHVRKVLKGLVVTYDEVSTFPWTRFGWQHDLLFLSDSVATTITVSVSLGLMRLHNISLSSDHWVKFVNSDWETQGELRNFWRQIEPLAGYKVPNIVSMRQLGKHSFALGWNPTLSGPVVATYGGVHTSKHLAALSWADIVVHAQNGFAAGVIILRKTLSQKTLVHRVMLGCTLGVDFPMPIVLVLEKSDKATSQSENPWSGLWLNDLLSQLPNRNDAKSESRLFNPVQEIWHIYEPALPKVFDMAALGVFPKVDSLGGIWSIHRNSGALNAWR